jgi:hypothetical protein
VVQRDDDAIIRTWRSKRGLPELRNGRTSGFIGWANRLDDKVDRHIPIFDPADTRVPMRAADLWRELFRPPLLIVSVVWIICSLAASIYLVPFGTLITLAGFAPLILSAKARVRQRKVEQMRHDLEASG